jgi:hypothetical protein
LEILIIVFFLAIFLIGAYYSHQRAQQRQQELAAFAAQIGWRFDPEKDRSHDDQYPQFGIFNQGHSRYAYNTFLGAIEVGGRPFPVKMGDYHYQETSTDHEGKSTTRTYTFSYLVARLPYRGLPDLFIRREGIFDAVKRAFGFDDIDFESAEFSKRFYVKCTDKRFAYDVIHPAMMEYMLAVEPPTIEIAGDCCCLANRHDWSSADFRKMLETAQRFFELWPKHLTSILEKTSAEGRQNNFRAE